MLSPIASKGAMRIQKPTKPGYIGENYELFELDNMPPSSYFTRLRRWASFWWGSSFKDSTSQCFLVNILLNKYTLIQLWLVGASILNSLNILSTLSWIKDKITLYSSTNFITNVESILKCNKVASSSLPNISPRAFLPLTYWCRWSEARFQGYFFTAMNV